MKCKQLKLIAKKWALEFKINDKIKYIREPPVTLVDGPKPHMALGLGPTWISSPKSEIKEMVVWGILEKHNLQSQPYPDTR